MLKIGREFYSRLSQITRLIVPWLGFWALFLWGWRVKNIFTDVPAYGDVLEVLWGIQWYHDSLLVRHTSPLFTPLVFHPMGWHTATLAHTPFSLLISLPLYEVGGAAFAYNLLAVLALIVSFAGCFLFVRLFASRFAATMAALIFTFVGVHWGRIGGHLHMLWVFGLMPWLALALEKIRQSDTPQQEKRLLIAAGLIWGLIINFALYGVFMGAMVFILWVPQIFCPKRLKQGVIAAIIAIVLALPTIVPYVLGTLQDHTHLHGVEHNLWWGASLNSLFVPSVFHPLDLVRRISHHLYTGPYNESGAINLGLLTGLLALSGSVIALRSRSRQTGLVWLTLTGTVLGLGLLLRWNGEIVHHPFFRPLNALIWEIGHALKPGVFGTVQPPPVFEAGIPLPGLVLTAVIPFWESARTISRFAFVGMVGAVGLAALALERMPRLPRYLLAAIWLIEILPHPTGSVPIPLQSHPAYTWLAGQELRPGEGIVDVAYPTTKIGGEVIWATLLHQKPTASGVGSSWPEHGFALWNYFLADSRALSQPRSALVLQQYGVRYFFLHMQGNREVEMWDMICGNSASFRPVGCFDPLKGPTPWPYPICVAEVIPPQGPINVMRLEGWSDAEDWGVWSEGLVSRAGWMSAAQQDYRLRIGAFPLCMPDRRQQVTVKVNGREVARYRWQECELWEDEIPIPASVVRIGWNEITLEYAYALSPAEATGGKNLDQRILAVGFTQLEVTKY